MPASPGISSSQRIAVNALVTYGRSLLGLFLGLFSSRWVLRALGQRDFGLYGVVGAIIVAITFLNSVTSTSVARFLAFSIGKGDAAETNQWFNTALFLHTALPVLLLLAGWPAGEWAVRHFLNIPPERLSSCLWVFRFSLAGSFVGMVSSPYIAMHTAKQRIAELAAWNSVYVIGIFLLAFRLLRYRGDALLAYAAGVVAINIGVLLVQVGRARRLYPECRARPRLWLAPRRLRELLSFAGWQLFGALGGLFRSHGLAVLLNKSFNPLEFPHVNAAYGIGSQVAAQSQTLSAALVTAFTPEITAAEGRGDRQRMLRQATRASKYGAYLVLLFAVPLVLEADYVLKLWLGQPPRLAATFCRLALAMLVVDKLTCGQMVAVAAGGRVAGYQAMLGGLQMLTLPLAWLAIRHGAGPASVMWVSLATVSACSLGRAVWAHGLVGASLPVWGRQVLARIAVTLAGSGLAGWGVMRLFGGPSLPRLLAVCGGTLLAAGLLGHGVVFNREEKRSFAALLRRAAGMIHVRPTVTLPS